MSDESDREPQLIRYLLGLLPPVEQEDLEERYFSDPALHEELEAVADDLIHDYLSGNVPADERQRFEAHFLSSPRQRERLELVRAIAAKAAPQAVAAPRSGVPAWLAMAAALVAAALLLVWMRPARPKPVQTAVGTPSPAPSVVTPARTPPPVVRVARAATVADIVVSEAASSVRFEVAVDGLHASYDAVVRTLQGVELWRAKDLEIESDGAPVTFSVPAAILAAGQYVLALEAESLRGEGSAGKPIVECTLRVRRE